MTTLRRLLLCLFALALLPGAQARMAMPMQASVVALVDAADAKDASTGGCHDAPAHEPAVRVDAHHADAVSGTAADDAPASMDCCPGHDNGAPACGSACACPPLLAGAVVPAPVAAPAIPEGRAWQRHGHATRTGPPDGPPKRPPIG